MDLNSITFVNPEYTDINDIINQILKFPDIEFSVLKSRTIFQL